MKFLYICFIYFLSFKIYYSQDEDKELNLNIMPSDKYKLSQRDYIYIKSDIEAQVMEKLAVLQNSYDFNTFAYPFSLMNRPMNINPYLVPSKTIETISRQQPIADKLFRSNKYITSYNKGKNYATFSPVETKKKTILSYNFKEKDVDNLIKYKNELETQLNKQLNINKNNTNTESLNNNSQVFNLNDNNILPSVEKNELSDKFTETDNNKNDYIKQTNAYNGALKFESDIKKEVNNNILNSSSSYNGPINLNKIISQMNNYIIKSKELLPNTTNEKNGPINIENESSNDQSKNNNKNIQSENINKEDSDLNNLSSKDLLIMKIRNILKEIFNEELKPEDTDFLKYSNEDNLNEIYNEILLNKNTYKTEFMNAFLNKNEDKKKKNLK